MSLHITTVRGPLREERAQQQLLRRLAAYDLRTWQLAATVQIQTTPRKIILALPHFW